MSEDSDDIVESGVSEVMSSTALLEKKDKERNSAIKIE